jgi:hypothetical protein
LRLADLPTSALDRLSRYEHMLWRQARQIVFTLESLRRRVDHCCEAWNKLVDQPWRIMSIGLRHWAHGVLINESWY